MDAPCSSALPRTSVSESYSPVISSNSSSSPVWEKRYHYRVSVEEAKAKWENKPNECIYESYYDTKANDLLKGVIVVIRRRKEKRVVWIVKSQCSLEDSAIHYLRQDFNSRKDVENLLKVTLSEEPFCQVRVDRYHENDNCWVDIALRLWTNFGRSATCYPVRTSVQPLDSSTLTASKLLFFYSSEHPEEFKKLNLSQEEILLKDAISFEVPNI